MPTFQHMVAAAAPDAFRAGRIDLLQVNLGLRCNMACEHCHHGSGPARTEEMDGTVFEALLRLAAKARPALVDVTGGAPELHPHIREWLAALRREGLEVQLRTNLTVLLEPECGDLPREWAKLGVRLLASLPSHENEATDSQRGSGAFERSMEAMHRLVEQGYGPNLPLRLDIASNPPIGGLLNLNGFEDRFRRDLEDRHGVSFGDLVLITNVPLGRFRDAPAAEKYVRSLEAAFNPSTVPHLACRSSLVVAWDGSLYDCDFNLAAGIPAHGRPRIQDLQELPSERRLAFGRHCFACTALEGSS